MRVSARRHGRERRRWSRYAVAEALPAQLVTEDGRVPCHIENVSLTGAKLRLARPARPRAPVSLDLLGRDGPGGHCVWARGDSIGVRFEFSDRSVALALDCVHRGLEKAGDAT